jgi:hypothetical protein
MPRRLASRWPAHNQNQTMSYESPQEHIERLESQVAGLTRTVKLLADNIRQSHEASLQIYALLADETTRLTKTDILTVKAVFENSRGFDEPFRQAMLKMIAEQEKQIAAKPSIAEELKKLSGPILPDDLFGPGGNNWPPQNPPVSYF